MITIIVLVAIIGIETQHTISAVFDLQASNQSDILRARRGGRSRTRTRRDYLIQ
jgi:hypothetical protein